MNQYVAIGIIVVSLIITISYFLYQRQRAEQQRLADAQIFSLVQTVGDTAAKSDNSSLFDKGLSAYLKYLTYGAYSK